MIIFAHNSTIWMYIYESNATWLGKGLLLTAPRWLPNADYVWSKLPPITVFHANPFSVYQSSKRHPHLTATPPPPEAHCRVAAWRGWMLCLQQLPLRPCPPTRILNCMPLPSLPCDWFYTHTHTHLESGNKAVFHVCVCVCSARLNGCSLSISLTAVDDKLTWSL